MAPRGYLKCSNCGKTYNKEVGATVNGKNYCDICKTTPLKDKQDRLDLIDYIWKNPEKLLAPWNIEYIHGAFPWSL